MLICAPSLQGEWLLQAAAGSGLGRQVAHDAVSHI